MDFQPSVWFMLNFVLNDFRRLLGNSCAIPQIRTPLGLLKHVPADKSCQNAVISGSDQQKRSDHTYL